MIDLELAREHIKADEEEVEDDLIEQYIASSQTICEGYCNRKFYETDVEHEADYIVALAELAVAIEARDDALAEAEDCEVRNAINNRYIQIIGAIKQRINGIVVDDTIIAAMLMTLGHLYFNRQEVVVGQYSGATQVPAGAKRMLEPYLWVGDLG